MSFLSKIKSIYDIILGDSRSAELSSDVIDDAIRYPSLDKGIPFQSVDTVINSQIELINKIQLQIGVEDEVWDSMVMPTIRNYASFVHLLPASEAHHHRGLGGLFRHGLEVAFWSLMKQEGVVLGERDLTPTEKHERVVVWRLASFVAGLCHDLGKPVLDINVHTQDDEWNPHGEFLTDFLKSKRADRYYVVWRPNRDKTDHEVFAGMAVKQIVAPELWKLFLGQSRHRNSDVTVEILKAITGTVTHEKSLPDLVKKADQDSVSRDLATIGKSAPLVALNNSTALPIDLFVVNAITDILLAKTYSINEPGAPVWSLKTLEGDHVIALNWTRVFDEVKSRLDKNGIKGIPSDKDRVAEILVERNLAKGNEQGGLYTQLRPEPIADKAKKGLWFLCFDPDTLYSNRLAPEPVYCVTLATEDEIKKADDVIKPTEVVVKQDVENKTLVVDDQHLLAIDTQSTQDDDLVAEKVDMKKQAFEQFNFSSLEPGLIVRFDAHDVVVKHPQALRQIAQLNSIEPRDLFDQIKAMNAVVNPISPIVKEGSINTIKLCFDQSWFPVVAEEEQNETVAQLEQADVTSNNDDSEQQAQNITLSNMEKAAIFDMLIEEMKAGVVSGVVVSDEKEAGVITVRKTIKRLQSEAGITIADIQQESRLKLVKSKYVLAEGV